MKKLFAIGALAFLITLSALPVAVSAAQLCPGGTDAECDPIIGVQYWCNKSVTPYTCVDTDRPANTNPPQVAPTAPATTNPAPAPGATAATQSTTGTSCGSAFCPLAAIPGLTDSPTSNLPAFLNNLYKFCIGAAAVIAVVVITMGGLQVMSGDSITAHSEGRDRIVGAILGLILVLAPFVVFSVINPSILNFGAFSDDLKSLQPSNTNPQTTPPTNGNGDINTGSGDQTGNTNTGPAPTAPTNLVATQQTPTSIGLNWTASSGTVPPAAYDVYDGTTLSQSVTGTTATLTGLAAGSTHTLSVKARSAAGDTSPASNSATITITSTADTGSYYILSHWSWAGQTITANGEGGVPVLTQTGNNCWSYTSSGNQYQIGATSSSGQPIPVQSLCQSDLSSYRTSESQKASQYPGYKQGVVDYACEQATTANPPQRGAPGPVCGGSTLSPH